MGRLAEGEGTGEGAEAIKVLLVEDEPMVSDMMAEALIDHGFEVHTETNAESALHYLQAHDEVAALFTDVNLPGKMDGSELAHQARDLRPDMPIVYASGLHTATSVAPLVSRSLFLAKPYRPDDVCVLLSRLTAR